MAGTAAIDTSPRLGSDITSEANKFIGKTPNPWDAKPLSGATKEPPFSGLQSGKDSSVLPWTPELIKVFNSPQLSTDTSPATAGVLSPEELQARFPDIDFSKPENVFNLEKTVQATQLEERVKRGLDPSDALKSLAEEPPQLIERPGKNIGDIENIEEGLKTEKANPVFPEDGSISFPAFKGLAPEEQSTYLLDRIKTLPEEKRDSLQLKNFLNPNGSLNTAEAYQAIEKNIKANNDERIGQSEQNGQPERQSIELSEKEQAIVRILSEKLGDEVPTKYAKALYESFMDLNPENLSLEELSQKLGKAVELIERDLLFDSLKKLYTSDQYEVKFNELRMAGINEKEAQRLATQFAQAQQEVFVKETNNYKEQQAQLAVQQKEETIRQMTEAITKMFFNSMQEFVMKLIFSMSHKEPRFLSMLDSVVKPIFQTLSGK